MGNEQIGLPPEISRFAISWGSLRKILQEGIADDIGSIKVGGEEAEIKVPVSCLRRVAGGEYGEGIDEPEFEEGEVIIWKSEPSSEGKRKIKG